MIATLKQRSSWTSSFLTGLIGWNGFALIAGLVLGYTIPSGMLFLVTSSVAVVQVLILRLGFFVLRLDRSVPAGLLWGAVTGAALMGVARAIRVWRGRLPNGLLAALARPGGYRASGRRNQWCTRRRGKSLFPLRQAQNVLATGAARRRRRHGAGRLQRPAVSSIWRSAGAFIPDSRGDRGRPDIPRDSSARQSPGTPRAGIEPRRSA